MSHRPSYASVAQALLVASLGAAAGCELPVARDKEQIKTHWNEQRAALKYELASEELRSGRTGKAVDLAREAVGLSPENTVNAELLARTFIAKGEFGDARLVLEKLLRDHPTAGGAWYLLGTIHERERRWDRVIDCYGRAVEAAPSNADYVIALAQALAESGATSAAIETLEEKREVFAAEGRFHLALAELHRGAGRLAEAAAAYEQALRLGVNDVGTRGSAGLCYFWLGRNADATETLRGVLRDTAKPGEALMCAYAGALLAQSDFSAARESLERFVRLEPGSLRLHLLLAQARSSDGAGEEAIEAARRAAELSPRSLDAQLLLAALYLQSGQLQAARSAAGQAVAAGPDDTQAWSLYGKILEQLGEPRLAQAANRKAEQLRGSPSAGVDASSGK